MKTAPATLHLVVRHDAWCPGVHGDGAHCICNPVHELVSPAQFTATMAGTRSRAQRREAARKAAKAARKGGQR